MTAFKQRLLSHVLWLAAAAVVLFPTYPMWNLNRRFFWDWDVNVWFVQYYAEYLRTHLSFPEVLNVDTAVGLPYPVFYGALLYSFLALPTLVLKAQYVLRLAVLGLLVLQFLSFYSVFVLVTKDRVIAVIGATLSFWAIYPFTNLYSRSAMAEFFAVGLFQCAVCGLCLMLVAPDKYLRSTVLLWVGAAVPLFAGAHPITAMYGLPVLGALVLVLLPVGGPRRVVLAWATAYTVLLVVILSPWLYAYFRFGPELKMSAWPDASWPGGATVLWPPELHTLSTRFAVFPYDSRTIGLDNEQLLKLSTPFLDAQINVPLLMFVGALLALGWGGAHQKALMRPVRTRGSRLFWLGLAVGGAALGGSVSPWAWDHLPRVFMTIQFAYRLVSYVNTALFLMAVAVLWKWAQDGFGGRRGMVVGVGLILCVVAGAGVAQKLTRGQLINHPSRFASFSWETDARRLSELPLTFTGPLSSYSTPGRLPVAGTPDPAYLGWREVYFPVGAGRELGSTQEVTFGISRKTVVRFFALAFPWNHLVVNGRELRLEDVYNIEAFQGLILEPGDYRVSYVWRPDRTWRILRVLSLVTFFGWFAVSCLGRWPLNRLGASGPATH